jgi:ABC-type Mn2+/Zn2+ transport system ATPase subunit
MHGATHPSGRRPSESIGMTRDQGPAIVPDEEQQSRQYLLARFWESALGFWRKGGGRTAWLLTFEDAVVRATVEDVGLGHFLDRLDEDANWEHVLSGGEKQRLAFARALLQRPDTIVMDEATAALDPLSQEQLMRLLLERLPEATVISVGHRAELEAFHTRKVVLEYHADGARLVSDESTRRAFGRSARVLSRLPIRKRSRKTAR